MIRDLLARNVEEVIVDSERQYRRILGWVRTTQPEFVDRIKLHSDSVPLFERHGVDQAILSTLNRRVDLPSGGYLIFDYAEAFTVIDVNTGRFVGTSGRLEDTITRNNIEAAREVMRQLRLRDIGGIIVIDFIDMASAKNRAEVLKVLQAELEQDRTKTYLVEISPLGLVEMTRQNVTAGVREMLTRICPTCGGEGVVLSEQTMAVEAERRLRRLARSSGSEAFLVKLNAKVAAGLVGPGGMKLLELERETGKLLHARAGRADAAGPRSSWSARARAPRSTATAWRSRTATRSRVKISEPHMYNLTDGVARLDGGYPVVIGGAIGYVGQEHKVRIDRATRTTAYATLLDAKPTAIELPPEPGDYELPEFDREVGERLELEQRTRPRSRRKTPAKTTAAVSSTASDEAADAEPTDEAAPEKPKPRRRSRAKSATAKAAEAKAADEKTDEAAVEEGPAADADVVDATAVDGEETATKKRRRGKRGGRGRSKSAAAAADGAAPADGDVVPADGDVAPSAAAADGDAPAASEPRRTTPRRPSRGHAAAHRPRRHQGRGCFRRGPRAGADPGAGLGADTRTGPGSGRCGRRRRCGGRAQARSAGEDPGYLSARGALVPFRGSCMR